MQTNQTLLRRFILLIHGNKRLTVFNDCTEQFLNINPLQKKCRRKFSVNMTATLRRRDGRA
jgi:hypothetical protein